MMLQNKKILRVVQIMCHSFSLLDILFTGQMRNCTLFCSCMNLDFFFLAFSLILAFYQHPLDPL